MKNDMDYLKTFEEISKKGKMELMQKNKKESKMNSNKLLIGLVVVLSIILIVQTSYMIGKNRTLSRHGLYPAQKSRRKSLFKKSATDKLSSARSSVQDYWGMWDPFVEMQRMHKTMNRMFKNSFSRALRADDSGVFSAEGISFDPDIDVKEQDKEYIIIVDLPGVDKDTINIDVKPNSVTISGERIIESEEKNDAQGFYKAERSFGSFSRTIPLMDRIAPTKVIAESDKGVLLIKLPKEITKENEEQKGVNIKVK